MFHWLARKFRGVSPGGIAAETADSSAFPDTVQLTQPMPEASEWEPTVPLIGALDLSADGARDGAERRSLALLQARGLSALQYVAETAARICEAPMAAVSMADGDTVWFQAVVGVELTQLPRASSFCDQAIKGMPAVLVVPDALADARFDSLALVTQAPHLRFYAGAPFVTADGVSMGAVSVADTEPRVLTPVQLRTLELLARQTVMLLDARMRSEAKRDL